MESKVSSPKDSDSAQPKWLTLIRIVLGLVILYKGISFYKNTSALQAMLHSGGLNMFDNNAETIAFIITYVNLLGGVFIAVGFLTRWVCLIQIPILLGAIMFVNGSAGMSLSNAELVLSVIVLILLILFLVKGSGPISADEYFRSYNKAGVESGHTKKFFQ